MPGISLLDVAFATVHDYPGGAASLAPRMLKGASTLAQELTHRNTAKLGLLDAERIMLLTGDLRILEAMANNCGAALVPFPDADEQSGAEDHEVIGALAKLAKEFGGLLAEVGADVADGKVNANELKRIDRQAAALMQSLHSMRALLGRMHDDGQPKGARR